LCSYDVFAGGVADEEEEVEEAEEGEERVTEILVLERTPNL